MRPSAENYISKRINRLERYIGDKYVGRITAVIIAGIIATHGVYLRLFLYQTFETFCEILNESEIMNGIQFLSIIYLRKDYGHLLT